MPFAAITYTKQPALQPPNSGARNRTMLLTENNVNYEALSQTIAEMSGEEVTLKRVLPSELESLHQAMLAPAFHSTAGFESEESHP